MDVNELRSQNVSLLDIIIRYREVERKIAQLVARIKELRAKINTTATAH